MSKVISCLKKHPVEALVLAIILVVAAFLYFYKLPSLMHFANDEARDLFIVRDMVEEGELIFQGPSVSVGEFYLGPAYYYMLLPFYLVSGFHPVAGGVMVALLALGSVALIYVVSRWLFSPAAAIITALLYATSFLVVLYARWPWNLNPLPFFILLSVLAFSKLPKKGESSGSGEAGWAALFGFSIGFAVQLHATAYLLVPIYFVLWLWGGARLQKKLSYLWLVLGFVNATIFILLDELLHNFSYLRGLLAWLTGGRGGKLDLAGKFITNLENFSEFLSQLWFDRYYWWAGILFLAVIVVLFLRIAANKASEREVLGLKIITVFFVIFFLAFPFLEQKIYGHYFIILFPLAYLALGHFLGTIFYTGAGKIVVPLIVGGLLFFNLSGLYNYWQALERGDWIGEFSVPLKDTKKAVEYIMNDSPGQPVAVVTEGSEFDWAFDCWLARQGQPLAEDGITYVFRLHPGGSSPFGVWELVTKK